jgi:hypothetical protein
VPTSQQQSSLQWSSLKDIALKALEKLAGPHIAPTLKVLEKAVAKAKREHDEARNALFAAQREARQAEGASAEGDLSDDEDLDNDATGETYDADPAELDYDDPELYDDDPGLYDDGVVSEPAALTEAHQAPIDTNPAIFSVAHAPSDPDLRSLQRPRPHRGHPGQAPPPPGRSPAPGLPGASPLRTSRSALRFLSLRSARHYHADVAAVPGHFPSKSRSGCSSRLLAVAKNAAASAPYRTR